MNDRVSARLIAGALTIALAIMVGCSSNSHNTTVGLFPLAGAGPNPWASNPEVAQILASACFDCHAEAGATLWYVKMSPSYWFSGSARGNLNFTQWAAYDPQRRNQEIEAIGRTVNRGEMPPWDYTVFHPAAVLTNRQKDLVNQWALSYTEALPAH